MADNNRGRPRDDDRDIYSSSREQRNSQRAPRYRNSETNGPRTTELKDNRIVLNEQIVLLSKINGETVEEQTNPLLPTKRLTAIIMSIVIFTVPRKNPKKNGGGDDLPPERKKRKQKKLSLQSYVL